MDLLQDTEKSYIKLRMKNIKPLTRILQKALKCLIGAVLARLTSSRFDFESQANRYIPYYNMDSHTVDNFTGSRETADD